VFKPTGIRPKFSERLFGFGIRLPQDMFEASVSSAAD